MVASLALKVQGQGALCSILLEFQRQLGHRFLLMAPVEGDFFSSELLAQGWPLWVPVSGWGDAPISRDKKLVLFN